MSLRPPLRAVRDGWADRRRRRAFKLGDLRRTTPIDTRWGFGRGTPVDRVYIQQFLERHQADIRGRALEVKSARYLGRFGAHVEHVDILDIEPTNPRATIVADLQYAPSIPSDAFDCVILTQVLYILYDVRGALATVHRILRPGGVLLATVPGITRCASSEVEPTQDWWRFTALSGRRLAEEAFGEGNVVVQTFGNVLAATAQLYGLAAEDLRPAELAVHDPAYEVTIGIRAVKRG